MLSGTATHPRRKRSFVCRGHGIMVCRPSAPECSQGIRRLGAPGRHDWCNSFCDHGKNLWEGTGAAHLLAAALLRLSLPRAGIRRLDLDVAESRLKKSGSHAAI